MTHGMRLLPGGTFRMGSERHYPDEAPVREVAVAPFWIDETPVTNEAFSRFVKATGYVTLAEEEPKAAYYPGIRPELIRPASLVFFPAPRPISLSDPLQWWKLCEGACWHRPLGLGSSLLGLEHHPVVHVALRDAEAYAKWVGKVLPTESEWEYAARGGLKAKDYAWGNRREVAGRVPANIWHGIFPCHAEDDGPLKRTSPVGTYPPNRYGLVDMIGNVWEWTRELYGGSDAVGGCCQFGDQIHPDALSSGVTVRTMVIKGGSHLCAPSYCARYRPAARYPQPEDTSTSHLGFRCIVRLDP